MKLLTLIASLVGSIALFGAFMVASSHPDGHYDDTEAKFSPGLERLFWANLEAHEFSVFDLEAKSLSPPSTLDLRHPTWAADGESILTLTHDDAQSRRRFATIDLDHLKLSAMGEPASFFAESPDSGVLLFGRGDYIDDTGHFEVHGFANHRLAGDSPGAGDYSMARFSPSGELLVISMWGYNVPDRFEIRRLSDWAPVVEADHEASFAFFLPDGRHLIAVESTAARIALHRYDLETGKLLKTSRESSGWCESAALSPDGKWLAIGTLNYDSEPQIELFSTDTLTLQQNRSVDGERKLLDLAFEPSGGSLLAISRSGSLWRWNWVEDELVEVTEILPKMSDTRWAPVWIGLGVYAAFWVGLIVMRRRIGELDPSPRTFVPAKFWLLGAAGFELLFLVLNFSVAISHLGIFLAATHMVIAGAAVLFLLSSAILRLRTNYPAGIACAAILIIGALFGSSVVHAAIASV